MLDRKVKRLAPESRAGQEVSFSAQLEAQNIILLGDPGSGKTELFREFARSSGEEYLTVRQFLNMPLQQFTVDSSLWIDALDESRSGRGDQDTINSIVTKLYALQPAKIRLSCRIADWLGKSDLAAFSPYFEKHGGSALVLHLQPLCESEQKNILEIHGFKRREVFIREAQRRSLYALLANPQTLLMLAKVVENNQWPATRRELYEKSVEILLRECNTTHTEREAGAGQHTIRELIPGAGALCAIRIISDCEGFTLDNSSCNDEVPSYRDLELEDIDILKAALTRRIFTSIGEKNSVDYVHRTIAEYLGAVWITARIQQGLPLDRVRALIGDNGQPTSSLRALHAWIAVLAGEATSTLLDVDPWAILTYADAAELKPTDKSRLMDALCRQAELDPSLIRNAHTLHGVGALADPSMIGRFREILQSKKSPTVIKRLVVAVQSESRAQPELFGDMQAILSDVQAPLGLRIEIIDTLCGAGVIGERTVCDTYAKFGADESGLRLRCRTMGLLFGKGLDADTFVGLIEDILGFQHDLPIGTVFDLDQQVTEKEAAEILNRLDFTEQVRKEKLTHRKSRDLVRIFEKLLVKAISQSELPDTLHLCAWIDLLGCYADSASLEGALARKLSNNPDLAAELVDARITQLNSSNDSGRAWFEFRRTFSKCFPTSLLIDRLMLAFKVQEKEKKALLYKHILALCFSDPDQFQDLFWRVYYVAEGDEGLVRIRDELGVCQLHDWHFRDQDYLAKQLAEEAASRKNAMRSFDENEEAIRSGKHLGWLGEISEHYFESVEGASALTDPRSRLKKHFGDARAVTALEGLAALVRRQVTMPITEIIAINQSKKYHPWWKAVLAGFDYISHSPSEILALPEDYLISVIALACVHPIYQFNGNIPERFEHSFLLQAIGLRRELAFKAYAAIAEADLAAGVQNSDGLLELLSPAFEGRERTQFLHRLLVEHPRMHRGCLETILRIAWAEGWASNLADAIKGGTGIRKTEPLQSDLKNTYRLWLAFGFKVDPDLYRPQIEEMKDDDADEMVWEIVELGGLGLHGEQFYGDYSVEQLEFVSRFVAERFPPAPMPTGVSNGTRNDWNGSAAVRSALAKLASRTDDAALAALKKLSDDPSMTKYEQDLRYLLEEQRVRRIDASHVSPSWRETVETLMNRAPASVEDLQALVIAQLRYLCRHIAHANTDPYKQFWNTDRHGRLIEPKQEELARDALIELLRPLLGKAGLRAEPEGHMAKDKRADIVVSNSRYKCVIELKRDSHSQLWSSASTQLERLYTRDPEASGYGIFGVFWYGSSRKRPVPSAPSGILPPTSAEEMQKSLEAALPAHLAFKIRIVVLDVSGEA